MLHVICKAPTINEATALCRLKASAHARMGYLLPVLPLGFTLLPPGPFPGLLLEELRTWKTSQDWLGLPKNTGDPSSWRGKETAAIGGPCLGESMDWLGREQGEGLISQKRRRRLRSRCEATNPAADPGTSGEMEVTGLSAPTVTVFISSSLNSFRSEKRYSRSLTIAEFKCKLELVVGSPASCMELELYGADDKFYSKLDQEDALLGSYPVDDGCRIHVIDHSGARLGEYEDVSKVEKYQISQEAYDQRQDSVRSFLKRSKLGRYNEEERAQQEAEATQRLNEEKTQASAISVGSRCEVRAPGQPPRRGTVMYVGLTDFKRGYWIGVRYDEPLGKNDGSVNGKRYFECQAKYGAFVKPSVVTVGDFPEEDYGLDEM